MCTHSREEESEGERYGEESSEDTSPARFFGEEGRETRRKERKVTELADQEARRRVAQTFGDVIQLFAEGGKLLLLCSARPDAPYTSCEEWSLQECIRMLEGLGDGKSTGLVVGFFDDELLVFYLAYPTEAEEFAEEDDVDLYIECRGVLVGFVG